MKIKIVDTANNDIFFGTNALFEPEELSITWDECNEQTEGVLYTDTSSFRLYFQSTSCAILKYPDNTSDTISIEIDKRQCNFFVKVFFNENLLFDEEQEIDNPVILIKE